MKPTKCRASEKKMRQEKRKKRGGEKAFFPSLIPKEGKMLDARMLAVSELYDDLKTYAFNPTGREMCL